MTIGSEVQDYIRRMSVINPEKDITMLDHNDRVEIYSIGDDGKLYLTYETDGGNAKFARVMLLEDCKEFAATTIPKTNLVAIASADTQNIVLAITDAVETLKKEQFKKVNLAGVLGGKKLTPHNLLIAALDEGLTLFIEMKDESGRIEQFACVLDSKYPDAIKYFPLASNYSSVVCSVAGRAVGQYVDGIYTYGDYGETPQLLYTPSYNVFGDTQPAPLRLKAEGKVDTIGSLKMKKKLGTHLFAIGEQKLQFYPYDNQKDLYHNDHPDPIMKIESPYFTEAKKLAPVLFGNQLYIYVLNEANVLSYTFADYKNDMPGEFHEPVTMMENVVYFDVSEGGTMNICTMDQAIFGQRDEKTGSWGFSEASLESDLDEYHKESAYVTKVCGVPPYDEVTLEAEGTKKIACYINDVYHNFKKITVKADSTGCIRVAQIATDFVPPTFTVTYGKETVSVNPALEAQKQLLTLTDTNGIANTMITQTDGTQRPLTGETQDENSLMMIASSISSMNAAMDSLVPGFSNLPGNKFIHGVQMKITNEIISILPYDVTHNPFVEFVAEVVEDVKYAVNWMVDKVKWLYDHTIKTAVEFVIGVIDEVWKFVVKVGEKVLEVVVDTVEHVFTAVKEILEFLGIPVDDILDWLKNLFGIDDVIRMNDSMKKLLQLGAKKLSEKVVDMKESAIRVLDQAIDSVENWAKIDPEQVRNTVQPYMGASPSDYGYEMTPRSMYMYDTMYGGLDFMEVEFPPFAMTSKMEDASNQLQAAVSKVEDGLEEAFDVFVSIGENIESIFGSKDLLVICDNLKQILGKVAIAGLDVCKAFIEPLFDFVACSLEAVVEAICKPVHIPFISEILKLFGVHEFSLVDLITFPMAFFSTIGAKLFTGKPIIDEKTYNMIMNATSIDGVRMGVRSQLLRASCSSMLKAEEKKRLFDPKNRTMAVTTKSIIASFAFCEMISSAIFMGIKAASPSDEITISDKVQGALGVVYTVVDFTCSYLFGYHCFSPMSLDDDSKYSKNIKVVKGFSEAYTICWWFKSAVSAFNGSVSTYSLIRGEESGKITEKASLVLSGVLNLFSFIAEIGSLIAAGVVDKTDEFSDEDLDKDTFICDTCGYLFDDVRGIMDVAFDFGLSKIKNPYFLVPYIASRAVLATGYGVCMAVTGSLFPDK